MFLFDANGPLQYFSSAPVILLRAWTSGAQRQQLPRRRVER
jgi:hypothetical protein